MVEEQGVGLDSTNPSRSRTQVPTDNLVDECDLATTVQQLIVPSPPSRGSV